MFHFVSVLLAQPGKVPGAPTNQKLGLDRVIPENLTDLSDLSIWWTNLHSFVASKGLELLTNLLAAITIFIIGRWLAKCMTQVFRRVALKARVDETLVKFACNLIYAALLSFAALSSLDRLGVDTTSFTAVVAAAGLAVGFALQGSLANFAAGVLLIIFKPFKVGDLVTAGGQTGVVQEIQIFNTLLKTADNALSIVPNNCITNATISNFSAEKLRRVDILVRCSYDSDLREVKRFLTQLLLDDDRILQLPPPKVSVDQLGEQNVSFVVQPWVKGEDYSSVRADLLEAIKLGFDQRGVRPQGAPRGPVPQRLAS